MNWRKMRFEIKMKSRLRKRRKRKSLWRKIIYLVVIVLAFAAVIWGIRAYRHGSIVRQLSKTEVPEGIDSQIIDVDGVSRNGKQLEAVRDIVIHYVGNPGSTAQQNHDFYESSQSSVSSHFIVGLEGEIIQCIPLNEMSAASNWRNNDTISIEVCHPDDTGKFNEKTYQSLVRLTAWLEKICNLKEEHIIRHYDITGKECPRYYVRNEKQWLKFKEDVAEYRKNKL